MLTGEGDIATVIGTRIGVVAVSVRHTGHERRPRGHHVHNPVRSGGRSPSEGDRAGRCVHLRAARTTTAGGDHIPTLGLTRVRGEAANRVTRSDAIKQPSVVRHGRDGRLNRTGAGLTVGVRSRDFGGLLLNTGHRHNSG